MPLTEGEKIRAKILHLLENKSVLDLGCGGHPIVPWAVGVDDTSESKHISPATIIAKIDPDSNQLGSSFLSDVVFSSHALEHIRAPILETLRYWIRLVRPGGRLILYLPDERRYVFDQANRKAKNPGHCHYLTPETFRWHLEQTELLIELFKEDPVIHDRYSFLVIARKPSP